MHRAIAVWLTRHPWRAAAASAACGALSPPLPLPFLILAGAIAVLVALRFEAGHATRYALVMAVVAGAAAAWVEVSAGAPARWILAGVSVLFLGPALLGSLLRQTGSLNLCFQVAVLGAGTALLLIHVALADPVGIWTQLLSSMLASMVEAGLQMDSEPTVIVAAWARTMWGALAGLALASVFGALLLGRWWQSLLEAPGAFGAEYRGLRLGRALGLAITAVFIAALIGDSPLLASLAWVAFVALAFQGLAAAHRSRAVGRLDRGWLVAIYVLLIVLPVTSIVVFMLAIWGFADNWLKPRPRGA